MSQMDANHKAILLLRPDETGLTFAGFLSGESLVDFNEKEALDTGLVVVELGADSPIPPIYLAHGNIGGIVGSG